MSVDVVRDLEKSLNTLNDEQLRYMYFTVNDIYKRKFGFNNPPPLFELSNEELDLILYHGL